MDLGFDIIVFLIVLYILSVIGVILIFRFYDKVKNE